MQVVDAVETHIYNISLAKKNKPQKTYKSQTLKFLTLQTEPKTTIGTENILF